MNNLQRSLFVIVLLLYVEIDVCLNSSFISFHNNRRCKAKSVQIRGGYNNSGSHCIYGEYAFSTEVEFIELSIMLDPRWTQQWETIVALYIRCVLFGYHQQCLFIALEREREPGVNDFDSSLLAIAPTQ